MRLSTSIQAVVYGAAAVEAVLPEIHVTGNKFFTESGEQFLMKGEFAFPLRETWHVPLGVFILRGLHVLTLLTRGF